MRATLEHPQAAAPAKPWYTHRWPWLLMLGPFIVVLAGSYTGWLAFHGQDALVVGDYYKQGKAINQDLRRDRAATAKALAFELRYDAELGMLRGHVSSHGAALPGALVLHLAHATMAEKDVRFEVSSDEYGRFSVLLPMLELSRWQVLLEDGQRSWRLESSWNWPAQRSIAVSAVPPA